MFLKRLNCKYIMILLLISVLIVGAVCGQVYIVGSHGHDCGGSHCFVCLTVNLIISISTFTVAVGQRFLLLMLMLCGKVILDCQRLNCSKLTLITLKVRLDN